MPTNDHLYHLLQVAAHRLKAYANERSVAAAGITAAQAAALFVIRAHSGATQRVVARELKQQESAVTGMVARLLEAGMIERRDSEADGRAYALGLTPAGEAALRTVQAELDAMNRRFFAGLGDAGAASLAEALRRIIALPLDEEAPGD